MKFKILCLVFLTSLLSSAQTTKIGNFFTPLENYYISANDNPQGLPTTKLYNLNTIALREYLKAAPKFNAKFNRYSLSLSIPNTEGEMEQFYVMEKSVMNPTLQDIYSDIKSYIGISKDNFRSRIYFSNSPIGFQLMNLRNNGQKDYYINAMSLASPSAISSGEIIKNIYSVFTKKDRPLTNILPNINPDNLVENEIKQKALSLKANELTPNQDNAIIRTYRLAVSTTIQYAQYFGGTTKKEAKRNTLSSINAILTRANAIFSRDFGISFVLVAKNDEIIFTKGDEDFYTNIDNQPTDNHKVINEIIKPINYDIGHLLTTRNNRSEPWIGVNGKVCNDSTKAIGGSVFTPSMNSIDHIFTRVLGRNFNASNIDSNRVNPQMVELGSGNTVMGYDSNYSFYNKKNHFHGFSIGEIKDFIKKNDEEYPKCGIKLIDGSKVLSVDAGKEYNIPPNTPFFLGEFPTNTSTSLTKTFTWDQLDKANGELVKEQPESTILRESFAYENKKQGPLFISLPPSDSNVRFFPNMQSILANKKTTTVDNFITEALPNVDRDLNFKYSVRDFNISNSIEGYTNNSADVKIHVLGNYAYTRRFEVLSQNEDNIVYAPGSSQVVLWDTALTFQDLGGLGNEVNCKFVDVLISSNEGKSWTSILENGVKQTDNNGEAFVTIPNLPSNANPDTKYRIMVKAVDNIFFAVSRSYFTIKKPVKYCNAGSSVTAAGGRIKNVKLSTINNSPGISDFSGYKDFTTLSTDLIKGSTNKISLSAFLISSRFVSVYIDYNRDGDFEDSGELVFSKSPTFFPAGTISGEIKVPNSMDINIIKPGITRMRVILRKFASPSPCGDFAFGQVQDYTVNIVDSSVSVVEELPTPEKEAEKVKEVIISKSNNTFSFDVFPNPLTDVLNLSALPINSTYSIFDSNATLITTGNVVEKTSINVSNLPSGVYFIEVTSSKGKLSKKFIKQ